MDETEENDIKNQSKRQKMRLSKVLEREQKNLR